MAKTITDTLIELLQNLIDKLTYEKLPINTALEIPKDNLASWHAAMEFLKHSGVVEYYVTDMHEKSYSLSLSPIDEQYDLQYIYTDINVEKLRDICKEYQVRHTESSVRKMQKMINALNQNTAGSIIIDVGPRIPDKVYDVNLHFEEGCLVLKSDYCCLKIPQTGRPAEILSVVAVKGCLNISFGKNAIETKLGKKISDSLPTIFKDNILRHELSNFADIKPKEITVYSKGQLRESELRQIKDKVENYYG